MKVVGITGGMGSGKTTVCDALAALGYAVYDADARAKGLMNDNGPLKTAVAAAFGPGAYLPDGSLNRPFLAQTVFNDENALQTLNALVHPAVKNDFSAWHAAQNPERKFVFKEAAILFEAGTNAGCHAVVYVSAPESVRVLRAMQRDGVSEEQVRKRLEKQWPDEKKIPLADFVIVNDGQNPVLPQIYVLLQWLQHDAFAD